MVSLPRNHFYRTPIRIGNRRPLGAGGFAFCAEIDHGGDFANQLDLEALLHRMQGNALDKPAQNVQRLGPCPGLGRRRLEIGDLAPIEFGQVKMKPRRGR